MNVLVTVTEGATVDDEFRIDGLAIDDGSLTTDLNEWDEYALETAVRLAEADLVDEVVTVTIGPEDCEGTIRQVLAKGADRAIRVWDDALERSEMLDVGAKTALLAAVVETEEPDLVLTGVQSADEGFMATGVSLAAAVDYGWAAVVNALEVDPDERIARVRRELEGGVEERTEVDLPAVLTIQTGINEPRYASLRGIRMAQRKELAVRSLADLGLEASAVESRLRLRELAEPESESEARVLEGSSEEAAAELATVLREQGVGR
ncbi:electron transfer flavoprotein subunit beta/FixA family protein [Natronobiforma cellulositropha]|uniref:electron transfer flavoprotein subunit beta/FixA family protein n=1 Tax=Natronobiforma cellulositropha TaxID=1679076 RepID=UPI0021D56AF3|nr:electron transfer flavoprotein subunit beta/FixA family protein [Natronobiforma cellulositropha]